MYLEKNECGELTVGELMSFEGLILSTAKKYLGSQFSCWKEDIAQDVLFKAWKNRNQFNTGKGALSNWLYTMTKNACLDLKDRKINQTERFLFEDSFVSSHESDASSRFKSMKGAIKIALNELSFRDRTILIMRFYFNCSGKEIAAFLEVPEKNMASYMKRAKERLKDKMDYAQAA